MFARESRQNPNSNDSEERKPIIVILDKIRHHFVWTFGSLSSREIHSGLSRAVVSPSSHFVRFRAKKNKSHTELDENMKVERLVLARGQKLDTCSLGLANYMRAMRASSRSTRRYNV
jgi:hypothetical protein